MKAPLCLVLVCSAAIGLASARATPAGEVLSYQKISDTQGGFAGTLEDFDFFGISIAPLGDLNGDLFADLVVGAGADDDGGPNRGAVYVLLLSNDGVVLLDVKISSTQGGFTGALDDNDQFGGSVTALGDLDGDLIPDLAVGAAGDDDGGTQHGALWILFLNGDGSVKSHAKISQLEGGFTGTLADFDHFGWSVAALGDLDGDMVGDLAVGAPFDDDGGPQRGAVWIMLMNADGSVKTHHKLSANAGGLGDTLADADLFGTAVAGIGDINGDQIPDLAVGSGWVDDGGTDRGAVWIVMLANDGSELDHVRISDTAGGFTGVLDNSDFFGTAVTAIGDLDDDGVTDLAVGARGDDDGGLSYGAVWLLFLNPDGTVKSHAKISDTAGGFMGSIDGQDEFGSALAWLGDLDGDGAHGLAVGAYTDDDGGMDHGAVWALFVEGVPACPGDCSDRDGVVATADLLALLAAWGTPGACDVDESGTIGSADLLMLLATWGPCPR